MRTKGTQDDVEIDEPRPRVQSAARVVAILLAVAQSENGLSATEISDRVKIGRQATYHLLHTLSATGMVMRDARRRYVLGLRVATLAEGFARQLVPSAHLTPLVRSLANETGEAAYVAGWWSGEIMALTFARGTNPVQAVEVPRRYVGNAHARASGKLLLAYASAATREAYLQAHRLAKVTPNTITSRSALEREFETIRRQGYATDLEEFSTGLCCLAVPVDGELSPFAFGLSIPKDRFEAVRDSYLAAMQRAAAIGREGFES